MAELSYVVMRDNGFVPAAEWSRLSAEGAIQRGILQPPLPLPLIFLLEPARLLNRSVNCRAFGKSIRFAKSSFKTPYFNVATPLRTSHTNHLRYFCGLRFFFSLINEESSPPPFFLKNKKQAYVFQQYYKYKTQFLPVKRFFLNHFLYYRICLYVVSTKQDRHSDQRGYRR